MKSRLVQWFVLGLVASVALPAAAQSSGTFVTTGSMTTGRFAGLATLLPNGQALVAGGTDGGTAVAPAELYTPSTGAWATTGSMTTARDGSSMTLLQTGQAGGINSSSLFSAELYNPAIGKWTATGSMPNTAGDGLTATVLQGGKVLVFEGASSTASLYDPASGQWSAIRFTAGTRNDAVATLLGNGKVMFTGGLVYVPRPTHTVAWATLYNPLTGAGEGTGPLLISRYGHSATLLQNGQVLVAGGEEINSPGSALLSEAELYTP